MSPAPMTENAKPSADTRAEAALWLAHLRGPERTPELERSFRDWLNARPENAVAFELASDVWERSAAVRRHPHENAFAWSKVHPRRGGYMVALAAAVAGIAIGAIYWTGLRGQLETAIGEQRSLTLQDGSRLVLNTDTRVIVQYGEKERRIRLERGEALFEVARHPDRPFIVTAAGAQVQALGTSFVVRTTESAEGASGPLQITLIDGKVTVTPLGTSTSASSVPLSARSARQQSTVMLAPGERLTLAARVSPRRDRPELEKVLAWQRGQVAFDDVPLADAIAEMNRYSTTRLVVEQPEAAAIRVGGVFRAGDAASFAQAIAATYRLAIREGDDTITLASK